MQRKMNKNSSIHGLNADKPLGIVRKMLWLLLNFINNHYCPNKAKGYARKNFEATIAESDWEKLSLEFSPARVLSDLFWMKLDWQSIKQELGEINIFDTGTGKGYYSLTLNDFAGGINSYFGVDYIARDCWAEIMQTHPFVTLKQHNSNNIISQIPPETNMFITQSAIEHFDNDLLYFEQIKQFVDQTSKPVIQIHLFPSPACLKLYLWHGIRQYTARTISHITRIFDAPDNYATLWNLGGKHCNKLQFDFISKPELLSKKTKISRKTYPDLYTKSLKEAILKDVSQPSKQPSFFALIIHSNVNQPILK